MGLSNTIRNNILNAFIGHQSGAFSIGSGTLYLALSTTQPTDDGDNVTEPEINDATTGYARVLLGTYNAQVSWKMGTPVDGVSTNTSPVLFPRAKQSWGTIGYVAFYSAATGGTFLGWSKLKEAKTIGVDYVANFDTGAIEISLVDVDEEVNVAVESGEY